jgi:hypothetical protein
VTNPLYYDRKLIRERLSRMVIEYVPFNAETCIDIAQWNGNMDAEDVRHALLKGQHVYTSFSKYHLSTEE